MSGARKRFYKTVSVEEAEGGLSVALDGRNLKTPGKRPLILPTRALAEAIAEEWSAQGDRLDAKTMPLSGLAYAAIDHIADNRPMFVDQLAAYGASDLICYRAEAPQELARRQAAAWQPLADWAEARFGIRLAIAQGVMPIAQAPETLAALRGAVSEARTMTLAGLHPIVTVTGSLIVGLGLWEGRLDEEAAWLAAEIDETYQAERWGEDEEAQICRERRKKSLFDGAGFIRLAAETSLM